MTKLLDTRSERDNDAASRAMTLPESRDDLFAFASATVAAYHAAVMAGDETGAIEQSRQYSAVVWKLNGGTFFACLDGPSAAGSLIETHCAALPGTVPLWGQAGEFTIEVDGIRALVAFSRGMIAWSFHFEYQAIDLELPFISETGYRSDYFAVTYGLSVDEVARRRFASILKEHGRRMIEVRSRDFCKQRIESREWIAAKAAATTYADEKGQLCFAL